MGKYMNKLLFAWKVSTVWMRVTFFVLLYLIGMGIYDATRPSSPAQVSVAAPVPVNPLRELEQVARRACERGVVASATNKSSVDFHYFTFPPQIRKVDDDAVIVVVKFSAKNAFGAESNSLAKCILTSDGRNLKRIAFEDVR